MSKIEANVSGVQGITARVVGDGIVATVSGVGPQGPSGTGTWEQIAGKPTEFPPSEHAHVIGDVTGLQAALDSKQAAGSYVLTTDASVTNAREWSAATVSQIDAETGASTDRKAFTPLRVFQAIAAWWAGSAAKAKLDGVAAGATANATDAQLRDRSTHTGYQTAATISDFTTAVIAAAPPTTNASLLSDGILPDARLSSNIARTSDVTAAVAAVVDAAPASLDTLNELAAALGDDANFASTVTNALAAKAPVNNPTFTGTVGGVTKAMVGLGNVDNTSDASKPISTATQIALDGKASASHTHTASAITDAGTAATRNVPSTGNAGSTEVVLGSDTRLTDERVPTDGSVTTAKIASGAVTAANIAGGVGNVANGQDISFRSVNAQALQAFGNVAAVGGSLQVKNGGGFTVFEVGNTGSVSAGQWNGTAIAVTRGGTGATTADGARTSLGLAIGTNVQAADATLTALAGVTTASNKLIYATGADSFATTDLTSFARTLLDDADEAAARETLGLGTNSVVTFNALTAEFLSGAYVSAKGGGGISVIAPPLTTTFNVTVNGVVDIGTWQGSAIAIAYGGTGAADAAAARTNLGVAYGSTAGTVCQGNDSRLSDAREWSAATIDQAEAEAGTAATRRAFTAQRVFQAIAAWWNASAAKTKLDGIAAGATANATDAQLRDRSTHTGTQAASTITGLASVATSGSYSDLSGVPSGFAPSAHKASHATGGTDALTPGDIGAAQQNHTHSSSDVSVSTAPTLVATGTGAAHPQNAVIIGLQSAVRLPDGSIASSSHPWVTGNWPPFQSLDTAAAGRITSIESSVGGIVGNLDLAAATSLTSISFPNLVAITGNFLDGSGGTVYSNVATLSFPNLRFIGGSIGSVASVQLGAATSLSFPALLQCGTMNIVALSATSMSLPLLTVGGALSLTSNAATCEVSLQSLRFCSGLGVCPAGGGTASRLFLPPIGTWKRCGGAVTVFPSNAGLPVADVDALLAHLAYMDGNNGTVSFTSTVNIIGTCAAPTSVSTRTVAGSSFVCSGTTCTVNWTGHGYSTGDVIRVSGVTSATNANRYARITVVNANQFTYTIASQTATGAGTATVRLCNNDIKALVTRGVTLTTN